MLHFGSSRATIRSGGLIFAITCILSSFLQCQANRQFLKDRSLCETLDVQHSDMPVPVNPDSVQIYLANENGEEVSMCYNPGTFYKVTIQTFKPIFGLLFLQAQDKRFGTFPYGSLNNDGLTDQFCNNAVSHMCVYDVGNERDYRRRCNLGTTLELPFLAPNDRTNAVEFKYAIVFTREEFLENRMVSFPPCPCDGGVCTKMPPTPDDPNRVCEESEFHIQDPTQKVNICPESPKFQHREVREVTRDGIKYTCSSRTPVRKRTCDSGCMANNGRTKCCRAVNKERQKDFICIGPGGAQPFADKFTVIEQTKCECYYCEDICPIVPALENSVEVEHTTAMEGNSVVQMPSSAPDGEEEETISTTNDKGQTTTNSEGETTTKTEGGETTTTSERETTTTSEGETTTKTEREVEQDFTTPAIELNSV